MKNINLIAFIFVIFSLDSVVGQEIDKPAEQLWKPVKDKVYLQERSTVIPSENPVQSIASLNERVFTLINSQLHELVGESFKVVSQVSAGMDKLKMLDQAIWAMGKEGLFRYVKDQWVKIDNRHIVDLCMHQGKVHAATVDDIFVYGDGELKNIMPEGGYLSSDITMVMEDGTQLLADPVRLGPITAIESYSETLHILQPGKLIQLAAEL